MKLSLFCGALFAACLTSFAADGDLDTTYLPPIGFNSVNFGGDDKVYGGYLQSDGKLLVVGGARPVTNEEMSVVRFNDDGSLDSGFATGGKFSLDVNPGTTTDRATCAGVQSDGKILVGGYTRVAVGNDDFAILRLTPAGVLDTTFGVNGIATVDFNGFTDRAVDLKVLADDSIVIAGQAGPASLQSDYGVAKLTASGALDATFGTGGKVTVDVGDQQDNPQRMAVQADGKIVVAGAAIPSVGQARATVIRLMPGGALDSTFGPSNNGIFSQHLGTTISSFLYDVKIQTDGSILACGDVFLAGADAEALVMKLTSSGTLDAAYGAFTGGYTPFSLSSTSDSFRSLILLPSGQAVVGGHRAGASGNLDSVMMRINADGNLDASFGGGRVEISFGGFNDSIVSLFLAADEKILAAAEGAVVSNSATDFYAARFQNTASGVPEIAVSGNSTGIADGDTTPAAADHTDFGSVFSGSTLARTFRISNVGAGSLNLTGTPPNYVSVSGSSDFTVTAQPSSASIGGSSSVTFNVTFTPSSEGQKTATVSILNNDSDESPYTFNITGLAAASVSGSTGSGNTIDTHQPSLQLRYMIAYDGENPAGALDSTGDGILIGEVRLFTANLVPGNWLECKGQAVSRTTYAALFNVAGTFFGAGDGSTTFNVPDLRLRVPIGTGPGFPLGSTHGGTNVTMTQAQMPAHTHSFPGGTTSSTGGTTPLPTRQPSLALTHLIAYSGVFPTVGEIRLFAGEAAPAVHWLKAQGQTVPVSTYSTLYAKIGNVYGGDLINFMLPNFVGRSVVGVGQGPGLTDRPLGSVVGAESVTLTAANLPEHTHTITGGNTGATGQNPPTGVSLIQPSVAVTMAINPFGIFPTAGGTAQTALTGEGRIFAYDLGQLTNAGMLPMDGSLQDIALYETLFNLIGTIYGGDGVVNFAMPDTRGRVIMGLADDLQLGNQLGSETVVLTVGNLPPHTHNLSAASAELAVLGNSQTIPSGDTTPGAADGTAFGSVAVTSGSTSRTYTLSNAGSGDLNLLGTPPNYVVISGSSDFTVTSQPATPVAAGGSTSFTVSFDPSSSGLKTATVTIASDSSGGASYTFAIEGSGAAAGPITWTGGDTLTGGGAPGEDGITEIGTFNVLRRGGFLAENGDLVFSGSLLEQAGPPLVTAANSTGLWKVTGGSLALTARTGTTVPDVAGAQFATLPEVPGINDAGEISLLGSLVIGTGGVTADNDTGLWSELGGSGLGLLIREDDVVIAAPESRVGKFASGLFATAQTGASTGEAVFSVTLRGASTQTAIVRASVTGAGVSLGVVAQEGTTAPGTTPPAVYANVAGSYSDPGRMDAQGNFVFAALTTPGSKEGIWYQPAGGAVSKVFFAGETAPFTNGAKFTRLQRPAIGANGFIAFRANLDQSGDNTDNLHNDGIWAGNAANPASFSCILLRGDGADVVSNLPPGSLVGNPWGGWLSNSNLGAWKGWLDVNGDGTSAAPTDVHAIYTNLTGAMQLHLKVGDAAPGTGNATFSGFDLPMVGGDNQYAFLGNLTGGDTVTGNNQGLWKSAPDGGALALALRKGESISTSEGIKIILKIDVPGSTQTDRRWEQPVMDSTGRMVVLVTFTDGSTSQILVP